MTEALREALSTRFPLKLREDRTFRFFCTSDYHAPADGRWDSRLHRAVDAAELPKQPGRDFVILSLADIRCHDGGQCV